MTYDEAARALAKFEALDSSLQEIVKSIGGSLVDLDAEQMAFLDVLVRALIADKRKRPPVFAPAVACVAACQHWHDRQRKN